MVDATEIDERQLIAAAATGDRDAFRQLVVAHQGWLVRLLEYLLGTRADAEDIAQDAFVRAFSALPRYRAEGSFRSWLRTIATRLAYNHRRDSAVRKHYTDEISIDPYTMNGSGPVMARDAIAKILGHLSYPFREILILRHVEDLSLKRIADLLEIGESAAKMRLVRARESFWQVYSEVTCG